MRKSDISGLRYTGGGAFSTGGPWRHGTRIIDSFELILVTRGTVAIREGQTRHTLQPEDYLLLHPGIEHAGWRTSEEPVSFYWIHFTLAAAPAMFSTPCAGRAPEPGAMILLARQLLQIGASPAYPAGTAEHMLAVLLAELQVQREMRGPQNAFAARVHEYIRSHSYEPLNVQAVAAAFGYHPDHLTRILKRCYGRTLREDIIHTRLERAKALLQDPEKTISQIALELGFEELNLFEKFFRYHQHCSPTQYRSSFSRLHTNHR